MFIETISNSDWSLAICSGVVAIGPVATIAGDPGGPWVAIWC